MLDCNLIIERYNNIIKKNNLVDYCDDDFKLMVKVLFLSDANCDDIDVECLHNFTPITCNPISSTDCDDMTLSQQLNINLGDTINLQQQ